MEKVESNVIKPDGRCLSCLQVMDRKCHTSSFSSSPSSSSSSCFRRADLLQVVSSSAPSATYTNPQLDRARSKSPPLSQSQGLKLQKIKP
jgi:hypothetical protein